MNMVHTTYVMQLKSRKDRFKYLRGKKGFQQQQVAQMLGIPRPTYIHYESGEIDEIPPHHLEGMVNLFGTTAEFILNGRDSSEAFASSDQISQPRAALPETKDQREIRALREALSKEKNERKLIDQIREKERELFRQTLNAKDEESKAREKALKGEIEILKLQLGGR